MYFRVTFQSLTGGMATHHEYTPTGVDGLLQIRDFLGIPDFPAAHVNFYRKPSVRNIHAQLTEDQAIACGRFNSAVQIVVEVPPASLNWACKFVVEAKYDDSQKPTRAWLRHEVNIGDVFDAWFKAGSPLVWNGKRS